MRSLRVLCLLLLFIPQSASAKTATEPTVYVFWSAQGQRSQQAVTFLKAAAAADPKLLVRYFELDSSPANVETLMRIFVRIGVLGVYSIPTIFVGHNVFLGFDNPDHAGRSILKDVEECRAQGCVDLVKDVVEERNPEQVKSITSQGIRFSYSNDAVIESR